MPLMITNATLVDGHGGEPLRNAAVLVEEGRIVALGGRDQFAIPAQAEVIDAGGRTLMPGMIDCHVHINHALGVQTLLETPATLAVFKAAQNLKKTLRAGFTTVRDAGGADPGLRMALERGLTPGPRLLVAATIGTTGTHMESYFPAGITLHSAGSPAPAIVNSVEEIRRAVRQAARDGFDLIKICVTGGVLSPQDSPDYLEFTLDEVKALVEVAASRGRPVMAHAEGTEGIKNAILAGVWSIEHASKLDDETAEMMLKHSKYLVPTLLLPQFVVDHGSEMGVGEVSMRKGRALHVSHVASFRKAVEAGLCIALGTDAIGDLHGRNAHELTLMVAEGLAPMKALVAATKTAAAVCRVDDQVGTLEVGKLADMLLVDGNPLADISILEQTERLTVFQAGKKVVKDAN